jgi:hypothetical protein
MRYTARGWEFPVLLGPLALFILGQFSFGQAAEAADFPSLHLTQTVKTTFPWPLLAPSALKTSPSGDVYFQMAAPGGDWFHGPVVRVSADGRNRTEFDLKSVSASEVAGRPFRIKSFDVDKAGNIYMLVLLSDKPQASSILGRDKPRPVSGTGVAIVEFDSEGRYESATFLEHAFTPSRITYVSEGSFWVSGALRTSASPDDPPQPFVGIASSSGSVRTLELADDPAREFASAPPAGLPRERLSNMALDAPTARGGDGNIYFMRQGNPAHVYVITPAGDTLKHLRLKLPAANALPNDMKIAGGSIVVCFMVPRSSSGELANTLDPIYSLYDAEDGSLQGTYRPTKEASGFFAGYTAEEGFEFLTAIDGNPAIKFAKP